MKARQVLRRGTAAEHERVDRLFGALDLACEEDYRIFLRAQAAAFIPAEAALDAAGAGALLPDWPLRLRTPLLLADLTELGEAVPEPEEPGPFETPAATLGGIYVLEGSRLGGALLKCSLADTVPQRFLATGQPPGSWRNLLEKLDELLYRADLLEAAVGSARNVFGCFERGGLRHLEMRAA